MRKSDLINLALQISGSPPVTNDQQVQYKPAYDMILESLLAERPWLFTLKLLTRLDIAHNSVDLRYKYRYQLPSDAVGVVNTDLKNLSFLQGMSVESALEIGYDIPLPEDRVHSPTNSSYIFLNGVLHSDTEITQIIYRREVKPEIMTPEFRELFAYKLGHFIASAAKDHELTRELKSLIKVKHVNAVARERTASPDPHRVQIQKWLNNYYNGRR